MGGALCWSDPSSGHMHTVNANVGMGSSSTGPIDAWSHHDGADTVGSYSNVWSPATGSVQ